MGQLDFMHFNAIVHAPCLRPGARLNVARADQSVDTVQDGLSVGSEVRLRFGVCCPDVALGRIIGAAAQPGCLVLEIGNRSWTLFKGSEGAISVPGLISESWFVADPAI